MYIHFINPTRKFIRWWAPPPHRVLLFVLQSRRKISCTFWSRERKSLLRLYFSGEIMLRIDRSVRRKMLRIGLGCVQWRNTLELQLFTRLHLRGWLSPAGHKPGRHSFAVMSVPMNRAKGLFFRRNTHTFNMDLARGDNTNRRQCGPKRRPILLRPTDPTLSVVYDRLVNFRCDFESCALICCGFRGRDSVVNRLNVASVRPSQNCYFRTTTYTESSARIAEYEELQ